MSTTLIILGILFVIVMIHEAGHLVLAKKFGVDVPVFSVGFGPRIIGVKFHEGRPSYRFLNFAPTDPARWELGPTEYRIAPILFGGFCQMRGELVTDGAVDSGDLNAKPYHQKFAILMGGVIVNILTGFSALVAVVAPKAGIVNGIKLVANFIYMSVVDSMQYTYLIITGQTQIQKWGEITEAVSRFSTWQEYLAYFGIISIIIAVFNLIPFPGLDGSFPFLWSLENVLGKKYGQLVAKILAISGFLFLMSLQLLIVIYWIFVR